MFPSAFPERWTSEFARFVKSYGVASLALQLDVQPSAVYHWIRGVAVPRWTHVEIIQRLARERGTTLSIEAVIGHAGERRAGDQAVAAAIDRREQKAAEREAKKAARDAKVDILLKSSLARQSLAGS